MTSTTSQSPFPPLPLPLPLPVPGYPLLANEMGNTPELAIFRRFSTLNCQSLLYYQAELVMLERQLRNMERESSNPGEPRTDLVSGETKPTATEIEHRIDSVQGDWATDWYWLGEHDPENPQWKLVLRIRDVLERYNAAIAATVNLASLPAPNRCDMRYLRRWLERSVYAHPDRALNGWDCDVWAAGPRSSSSNATHGGEDLFVVRAREKEDPFSTFVVERLLGWVYETVCLRVCHGHRRKLRSTGNTSGGPGDVECSNSASATDSGPTGFTINDSYILRLTSFLATALACLLPVASIVVLYYVEAMKVKLGLVACFTFALAMALAVFTTVRRSEVFATTAAFAAVMVVFISGNGPGMARENGNGTGTL